MSRYDVLLPGYEEGSRWGWDPMTGTWFLQLYRNGSGQKAPNVWISGKDKCMYPLQIAQKAAALLKGSTVLEILLAMDLGVREVGFKEEGDAFGDIGTVPRLAQAIAHVAGLPPHLTLQAMVSEGGMGPEYYGGWPVVVEDDAEEFL